MRHQRATGISIPGCGGFRTFGGRAEVGMRRWLRAACVPAMLLLSMPGCGGGRIRAVDASHPAVTSASVARTTTPSRAPPITGPLSVSGGLSGPSSVSGAPPVGDVLYDVESIGPDDAWAVGA